MTNKLLIIVDMQNDFIDESLANPAAQTIVPDMVDFIKNWQGDVIYTLDTHQPDYLITQEGVFLPVAHCIDGTKGHQLNVEIAEALNRYIQAPIGIKKGSFGYNRWDTFHLDTYAEVMLVGTCTDICVISNALGIKAAYPELPITVISNLCAGLTETKHKAALEVMKSCQIKVI